MDLHIHVLYYSQEAQTQSENTVLTLPSHLYELGGNCIPPSLKSPCPPPPGSDLCLPKVHHLLLLGTVKRPSLTQPGSFLRVPTLLSSRPNRLQPLQLRKSSLLSPPSRPHPALLAVPLAAKSHTTTIQIYHQGDSEHL